jgi:putative transposase
VFVACMLDLFTREIVGWAIDSHMRKSLVHDALKMAEFRSLNEMLTGSLRLLKPQPSL